MTSDALLGSWIVEALGVSGRSASPLAVAKLVWARHEQDLRSAGDLLFTWQLDLRSTAAEMLADGRLSVEESGDWTLPAGTPAPAPAPARRTWSDDEILAVVEGYVAMLRAEHSGQPIRQRQVLADIEVKTGRTGDQLERMLANISHVIQEHGITPLSSYRPRSNVPVGVRAAVAAALNI
ncbi:hypothetical protein [Nocardioides sp. Soil796]|uniref:hypothetical protein n=1 Tax=Nocardioides sp. Soil796 TaxID=1736412 RepID=UPI000B152792|nr:hypothetical protein [Nocardioides sp. Soil796]